MANLAGGWEIVGVDAGKLPQKVATGFGQVTEGLLGAQYTPLVYVGSQVVNGINHMILAEQVIVTGRDTTALVKMIINEKPVDEVRSDFAIVNIETIETTGGTQLGGWKIQPEPVNDEVQGYFEKAFETFLGAKYEPLLYVGCQVVNGINYKVIAKQTPIAPDPVANIVEVVINKAPGEDGGISIVSIEKIVG